MKKRKRPSSFFDEFEFWITLGVSVAQERIVVLGFAHTKWEAQAAGLERNAGPEKCEHWEVFRFGDDLGQKIRDWFVTCGMSRQDADDSARELAKSIKEKLPLGREREKKINEQNE